MRMRLCLFFMGAAALRAQSTPSTAPDTGALYDTAKQLFDQLAPDDVKAQYYFPSRQEFDTNLRKFQAALDTGSLQEIAPYAEQIRPLLPLLRRAPGYSDYADWLAGKLDELEVAKALTTPVRPGSPSPTPPPLRHPTTPSAAVSTQIVPYYSTWLDRVQRRAAPAAAAEYMPRLKAAFAAEGVPTELAWLAEAESSFNPSAQSPAGAKGMFQLKADTAKGLGLSTFMPDERTNPEISARAAARQLKLLGHRFGSWPLAIAAYNAGEGRVSRAMAAHHAKTFAEVSSALPGETRMYVPKVCALMAVRAGVPPDRLPVPR
jgi:membrane-bound lytic murein transglycosylase D